MPEVVFKEAVSKSGTARRVWIHQSGLQALVLEPAGASPETPGVFEEAWAWIESTGDTDHPIAWSTLVGQLDAIFARAGARASLACVTRQGRSFHIESIGVHAFHEVLQAGVPRPIPVITTSRALLGEGVSGMPNHAQLKPAEGSVIVLCGEGLAPGAFERTALRARDFDDGDFVAPLAALVGGRDIRALVFPVADRIDAVDASWPYDPFVGLQEERVHERRGLKAMATALFACAALRGFRIVPCPAAVTPNASRLLDALVICPLGVFPVELKHHSGSVELRLGKSRGNSMLVHDRGGQHAETNPVDKVREALRTLGSLPALKGVRTEAKRAGIVLFTHPDVTVCCVDGAGPRPLPCVHGDVVVCTPANLVEAILERARSYRGKSTAPVLSGDDIARLVQTLLEPAEAPTPRQPSAHFVVDFRAIRAESNDYCTVYPARHAGADDVWAKAYRFSSLAIESREAEIERIGREAQILQRLGRRRTPGVPFFYEMAATQEQLYVFIEPGHPITLDDWIRTDPLRAERLRVLRQLAQILQSIAHLPGPAVVHRNVEPRNVRLDAAGRVQLINFELAQVERKATVMAGGRQVLADTDLFRAPEVLEPGRALTSAADVYSFMMCVHFVLSWPQPMRRRMEFSTRAGRPNFWPAFCGELGLPAGTADTWRRALSGGAMQRPTIDEAAEALSRWQ